MSYQIIKEEFEKIEKMGWIRARKRGDGEAGLLFEELLGIENNKMPYADYFGIEIKTKYSNKISEVTLFNLSPKSIDGNTTCYLLYNYGYRIDKLNNYKNLNVSLYCNQKSRVGNYKMELIIERDTMRIFVYDRNDNLIDTTVYWELNDIKEKIEEKCKSIAYIEAARYYTNGMVFYKYKKMTIYNYVNFEKIVEALKSKKLFISLKISTIKTGENKGKIHNHGTAFRINEENLKCIFKEVED